MQPGLVSIYEMLEGSVVMLKKRFSDSAAESDGISPKLLPVTGHAHTKQGGSLIIANRYEGGRTRDRTHASCCVAFVVGLQGQSFRDLSWSAGLPHSAPTATPLVSAESLTPNPQTFAKSTGTESKIQFGMEGGNKNDGRWGYCGLLDFTKWKKTR